jgi:hypothetical protein
MKHCHKHKKFVRIILEHAQHFHTFKNILTINTLYSSVWDVITTTGTYKTELSALLYTRLPT